MRRLKINDLAWTLIPAVIWLGAIYSRGWLIRPYCSFHPEQCVASTLWSLDRLAVGLEVPTADSLSFTTQGLSGVLALAIPLLWALGAWTSRRIQISTALATWIADLVIFAQTTCLNGLFTELAHLVSWRPRPFVYMDPARAGDFSNYTSFYSGHTSFSAASTTYIVLTLSAWGAPRWVIAVAAALAYGLMSMTGLYRVLAGRHFPSDVLIGALAGIAVAHWVNRRHPNVP